MSNDTEKQDFIEVVTFSDDEGNKLEMELLEEFEHKGKKYAVLLEYLGEDEEDEEDKDVEKSEGEEHEHGEDCDCGDGEESIYIFEVVKVEDGEEFLSVDDDELMAELSEVVESILFDGEDID